MLEQKTKKITKKVWEELTLGNGFIFSKVMLNPEICKRVLQEITDLPEINRIEYVEAEKTIDVRIDSKGVRLDVYVKDGNNTVYNIEMQATDTKELRQRARYYQAMVDLDLIEKGGDYIDLPDSYVIFVCRDDIFNKGLYRYTFTNRCMELDDLALDDGTTKIFLNSKGTEGTISEGAKDFLKFIEGQCTNTSLVKLLEDEVALVKSNEKWRVEYVKQYVHDTLNFRNGKEEGKLEIAKKMLERGDSLADIVELTELSMKTIEELKGEM